MSVYTDCVPPISAEDYQALFEDIKREKRVYMPIVVDERGVDIDGANRRKIWNELRTAGHEVEDLVFQVVHSKTESEKRSLARSLNLHRRHLTQEQRRLIIADELRENPSQSNRQVAKGLGVDDKTVGAVRRRLEGTAEIPQLDRTVGADGKERPSTRPAPAPPVDPIPDLADPIPVSTPSTPSAPIFATGKQLEKIRELAEAGKMNLASEKGIGAAHKQMREERRGVEMLSQHAENQAKADTSEVVTIEQGDVFDVLARIPTGSVAAIFSDWPYNIAGNGGGTKIGPDFATFKPSDWKDDKTQEEWLEWCHRVMAEFKRVLVPSGSLMLFTDRALISYLWDDAKKAGMRPKNIIVWHKLNAAPNARGNLDSACELAIWIVKGSGYTFHRPATGQCSNVWSGSFVSGPTRRDYPHPTAKPVALFQHYIELFTNPGDLVLDPFGGSGATLEACLRSGRRCHTSDDVEKFVATMAARYRDVAEELGLKAGPPPHEHVYRSEGGQMVCRECGREMRLDVDDDEPEEQVPPAVTLSDVLEAELEHIDEDASNAVVHRILMPDGSTLMTCRDHAVRGCMWGREGYEYSLAPAGSQCEMCHPEAPPTIHHDCADCGASLDGQMGARVGKDIVCLPCEKARLAAAPPPPVRRSRPLPKRVWLVKTRRHPNSASTTIMEHTYRETARTAEEARERILSLPLVVEVLDVRPVENWGVK